MATAEELRRINLRALVEQWGGGVSFAKKIGYSNSSFVSQMSNGERPITEKTARKVEEKLKLPKGWLSADHSDHGKRLVPQAPIAMNEDLLTEVVVAVGEALEQANLTPAAGKFADLVTVAYQHALANGMNVDRGYVARLVKLTKL